MHNSVQEVKDEVKKLTEKIATVNKELLVPQELLDKLREIQAAKTKVGQSLNRNSDKRQTQTNKTNSNI